MTILANYPIVQPSLNLDFAHSGGVLDPRVTFSRSTTAPYYDGKTSVLAEQNLLLQSQALTNATYWVTVNSSVTGNSTTAPDGTTTANTITDNATNGGHRVYQGGGNLSSATALTASAYFLQGTGTFGQLGLYDGSAYRTVTANLSTGVITETFGTATSTITALSGGWYRLTLSFTGGSSNATLSIGLSNTGTPNGLASYVGTGSTIYAWNAQLEQRSSVTAYNATTTSAITNYIPQLLTAPINAPRFDFNPTTGESLGLLIEQSSTNLLTYSQDFSNAAWSKARTSIATGADIAPDGTQTMQLLVEDTSTNSHIIYNASAITVTSGTSYTFTIYAKQYGRTWLNIVPSFSTGIAYFDLANVALGTVSNGTASITSVGNGVVKCSFTVTTNTTSGFIFIQLASANGTNNYTGNGYSGIYIWQAQLEALPFATSPIPTTSAQVTRAADVASITGTNFSSWFNQAEGTMYAETQTITTNTYAYIANLCDGGNGQNEIALRIETTNYRLSVVVNNIAQVNLTIGSYTAGGYNKTIMAYKTNDFAGTKNGGTVATATSGSLPTVNQLVLGTQRTAAPSAFTHTGTFKKIAYYPIRVTNAQLQALTGS